MEPHWVPFTLAWDDHVPVDISFVFAHERPAGKHGFLSVQGPHLVFADGTEARFWGTCFNAGANFPSHDYSEMVARRLAKFGMNMVRTHQMDAEWSTPNIFASNRAAPKDHTRTLDAECMDRLDYLIYCLKQEGIYTYLDLLTYRQFLPGDAVDAVDQLPQAAKPYTYFDPRLIELQKEFNRDIWTHVNPYTGLAYKDEPAIALTELKNESDMFAQPPVLEPYRSRLEAMYRSWAEEQGLAVAAAPVDFAHPDAQSARFMVEVMVRYYREMIAHLRAIGVKVPINGTNWSINLGVLAANLATDLTDSHTYWAFPQWESTGTDTTPMVSVPTNTFAILTQERVLDKPFFVSEWDHAWPDEWRAESPLAYAAVGALQGWSGLTIHTYRYGTWRPVDRLGGGGSTINGITYRNHFDCFNDPAKIGLFPHAALILRRGDVRPAQTSVAIQVADTPGWELKRHQDIPALALLPEMHRCGMALPGQTVVADEAVPADQPSVDASAGEVTSDTGELYRNWQKRYGTINTPRTQAAYGFLGGLGRIVLQALTLNVQTDFATIALSSLTDEPIAQSASLLLTAVGRCDNTDARYDEQHTKQLDFGRPPILIEPIVAALELRTSRPNLKVWVISEHGEAVTRLPTTYQDGVLRFQIGPQPTWNPSTIYYLLRI
ncbi:MAG: hypothetical protein ACUVX9_00975 [Anaerolineae bacterium]